jgi:hypothetical protein
MGMKRLFMGATLHRGKCHTFGPVVKSKKTGKVTFIGNECLRLRPYRSAEKLHDVIPRAAPRAEESAFSSGCKKNADSSLRSE